jgi:hypothetical protein
MRLCLVATVLLLSVIAGAGAPEFEQQQPPMPSPPGLPPRKRGHNSKHVGASTGGTSVKSARKHAPSDPSAAALPLGSTGGEFVTPAELGLHIRPPHLNFGRRPLCVASVRTIQLVNVGKYGFCTSAFPLTYAPLSAGWM